MIVIGIDPHKSTHTATALDPATNSDVGSLRIEASVADYQRLIVWAKAWPERTWAIENADGLGHHLALWLLARGEVVLDIPTTATARVRELSRGGRRKNDRIDAAAAASVAALQGDARQVYPETTSDSLALLDERRVNLSHSRTRTVNQLHALLRELMAGGAPTSLTPVSATAKLRGFRARTGPDRIRVELAKELIADVRRFDEQLVANARDWSHRPSHDRFVVPPRRPRLPGACPVDRSRGRRCTSRLEHVRDNRHEECDPEPVRPRGGLGGHFSRRGPTRTLWNRRDTGIPRD
jgi:transposase